MSRTHSAAVLAAIYARETDEVELKLLTIDHPDMVTPIRVVADQVDVVSRGDTYTAFPFALAAPPQREGELPQSELIIDNVSRLLTETVRSITTPATMTLEVVLASDPDTLIAGPWAFEMRQTRINVQTIRAALQFEPILEEPFPAGRFTPTLFAGIFNAVDS